MTNIAIKSDKITPFGGILSFMQQFDRSLSFKTARQHAINIYTVNHAYAGLFPAAFG